jgi:hypothetical protein
MGYSNIYINNGCPVRAGDSIISISMQVLYQNIAKLYKNKLLLIIQANPSNYDKCGCKN